MKNTLYVCIENWLKEHGCVYTDFGGWAIKECYDLDSAEIVVSRVLPENKCSIGIRLVDKDFFMESRPVNLSIVKTEDEAIAVLTALHEALFLFAAFSTI